MNYELISPYIPNEENNIELIVQEVFRFKNKYYNEENLSTHTAYLSDTQPGRTSSAFAIKTPQFNTFPDLPAINMDDEFCKEFPFISKLSNLVSLQLGLDLRKGRMLFNIQEYYDSSAPVPKHFDGEFLDFHNTPEGDLIVDRGIRPRDVAVLTLINNTDGAGTTLHKGDLDPVTLTAGPGDLLCFNNHVQLHSVNRMTKRSDIERPDKLVRLIIGWRSLSENCRLQLSSTNTETPLTSEETNTLLSEWIKNEWPLKWEEIVGTNKKAAF